MPARFNPPPNWPQPAPGWQPPPGWKPDPAWGPAPNGWNLWLDEQGRPVAGPSGKQGMGTGAKVALGVLGGLVGLCALFGIIGALSGGDDTDPAARTTPSSDAPSADASSSAPPAESSSTAPPAETTTEPPPAPMPGIGTPVRDGKFEFTVTGVERVGTTVGESFLEETAQGEFLIVRVNVTNIGNEPQTLSTYGQVLANDKDQKFEPSSAIFSLPDADKFFIENINPGNTVQGAPLLFDVPPGTVLKHIELHDSPFSGGVEVSLAGS